MKRRNFLGGLIAGLAAPAVIIPKMPIIPVVPNPLDWFDMELVSYRDMPPVDYSSSMRWKPQVTLVTSVPRASTPVRKLVVQPMFNEIVNLPILPRRGLSI